MKSRSFFKVSASTRTAATELLLLCAELLCAELPWPALACPGLHRIPACTSKLKLMSPMVDPAHGQTSRTTASATHTIHHPTGHFLDATVCTCVACMQISDMCTSIMPACAMC